MVAAGPACHAYSGPPGISIAADVQTDNESLAQTDDSRTEAVGRGLGWAGLGRLLEIMQKCS